MGLLKKVKKAVKRVGRKALAVHSKIAKVARPVLTTAATVAFGPVAGAAVAGITQVSHRYAAGAAARAKGLKGHAARTVARKQANRTLKHSAVGLGVGAVGAAVVGGLGAGAAGLVGQKALGLGSGAGIAGLSNPLMSTGAQLAAAQKGQSGGAVDQSIYTEADLYNGRAPSSGGAPIDGLVAGLPGLWNDLTGQGQPERPAWLVPALIVGGLFLLSQAA